MNLQHLGVQEMNAREIKEVDGGNPWRWALGLALAVLNTDWDQAAEDFSSGFNDAHKK